jgi:hypothetical protein
LFCTELELTEVKKNEAELKMSYKLTKDALNVSECEKFSAIEHSHELYLQECSHQNQIIKLKQQVDVLKKQNIDKDNELWFFRSLVYYFNVLIIICLLLIIIVVLSF